MSRKVRALVLAGNGTNCEMETAHVCRLAGADEVDIVFIWDLAAGRKRLSGFDLLCLPGGFLDGDDLGSAKAGAARLLYSEVDGRPLFAQVEDHIAQGGLVIGICNGFQLMVKLGLLPQIRSRAGTQEATLTFNDSGRFEDRWVHLTADAESPCVFTRGLKQLDLPVRHGEGKLVFMSDAILSEVLKRHLAPLFYAGPDRSAPTVEYPCNPNGSPAGIAGLCDPTGRLFGLMPHPEGFWDRTNHPHWTRASLADETLGLRIFENAVSYARKNL